MYCDRDTNNFVLTGIPLTEASTTLLPRVDIGRIIIIKLAFETEAF
jgi:hypothetical protein